MTDTERARWAILAGWLIALLGVICYVLAAIDAGEGADIMDAVTQEGAIGWASLALLTLGVAIWLFGNLTLIRHDSEPAEDR